MIQSAGYAGRKEGILLDPVYSGKGFAGLIGLIKNKKFTKNDNVLFIHTGGAVSLSAYEWAFQFMLSNKKIVCFNMRLTPSLPILCLNFTSSVGLQGYDG